MKNSALDTHYTRVVRIDLKSASVTMDITSSAQVDPLEQYIRDGNAKGIASALATPMDPQGISIHGRGRDQAIMDTEVDKLIARTRSNLTDESGQPLGRERLWEYRGGLSG